MSIQQTRIQLLNDLGIRKGDFVLYWMQQSQRAAYNHALEYAVQQANQLDQMLLVVFGLMDDYPEANLRHYTFMLEGLKETEETLASRGIKLVLRRGQPSEVALRLGRRAAMIVCDRGYLKHQRAWRKQVAQQAQCRVVQVESDVIVPVEVVSDKAEYAARTIRPKIHRNLEAYLSGVKQTRVKHQSLGLNVRGEDLGNMGQLLQNLNLDRSVPPVSDLFKGGTSQAVKRFDGFLRQRLKHYDQHSNQPQTNDISHMSPYLHFGQISPLYLALKISRASDSLKESKDAYIEELVVRRELAMNFAFYTPNYDAYGCIPGWARKTLAEHRHDKREYIYSQRQLEGASTHDPYWNASMLEMKHTGFMHNYMRMYWGKKILEWSSTPQKAFRTTLAINNKYFLDGRDPNSYTGVAWIYGVHDRAWSERLIFGKTRYMAASGLERKCDIAAYVKKVEDLVKKMG
jgi:deoxyribodipyrimidine photo-lyase